MNNALPFLVSLFGVASDYASTQIGLSLGYYETHPFYNPFTALILFWLALLLLTFTLPKDGKWDVAKNVFASVSFLGAVNNILVILGAFNGIVI